MARIRFDRLPTERANPRSRALDRLAPAAIARLMNRADRAALGAVGRAAPAIGAVVTAIVERLAGGGRLIFVGAGTSGGEAAECHPHTPATGPGGDGGGAGRGGGGGGRLGIRRSGGGARDATRRAARRRVGRHRGERRDAVRPGGPGRGGPAGRVHRSHHLQPRSVSPLRARGDRAPGRTGSARGIHEAQGGHGDQARAQHDWSRPPHPLGKVWQSYGGPPAQVPASRPRRASGGRAGRRGPAARGVCSWKLVERQGRHRDGASRRVRGWRGDALRRAWIWAALSKASCRLGASLGTTLSRIPRDHSSPPRDVVWRRREAPQKIRAPVA